MQIPHVRLLVDHFADRFRFYRDFIRMTPMWGDENSGYASFQSDDGQVALALFLRQPMSDVLGTGSLPVSPPGQDKFILIFGVEDVDSEVQRIQQQGGEILLGPKNFPDWGYRGAYLRDPDGNLVELLTSLPEEQWSEGLREADEQYHSPTDTG
jgi:catechol 2,3-dioxygenase-like lactoylglutathione lyase family enzyme